MDDAKFEAEEFPQEEAGLLELEDGDLKDVAGGALGTPNIGCCP